MLSVLPPKKIAVIIPKYGVAGGAEHYAAILTELLANNPAYEIHVIANRWSSSSTVISFHHVPIISFPRFLTTISFAWFANRKAAQLGCDIIHTHDRILHADIFTMHGVPHSFWIREIRKKKKSLFDRVTDWVEKQLLNDLHCRLLLPVSLLASEQYSHEFPNIRSKLQVLHPGIDLERFHPRNRETYRTEVRERFKLSDTDLVVLFVGMNFELKGLNTLIKALALSKKQRPGQSIKLLVVGKGNQAHFHRLAMEQGLKDTVCFAGVCTKGIEKFYGAADLFALLSDFDTFGMSVLEAMASGLPVIVSPTVGAKDLVIDDQQGYIVDKENIIAVAKRIIALHDDKKRLAMGQAARQMAERHGWEKVAKKIGQMYDEILATC
jgi:UDP-glucose:(heptosyl)LPS alpha-1,3-glucosyltransferase